MKSEHIIDIEKFIKERNIEEDVKGYVEAEIAGAETFFQFFIWNIFQ